MIDAPILVVAFCALALVALAVYELVQARVAYRAASRRLHLLHQADDEGDLPHVTIDKTDSA